MTPHPAVTIFDAPGAATLDRSEQQYRLLFEGSPQPMWVWDLDTFKFLAVNDAAVRVFGYTRDEFLDTTITAIRPPEDVPSFLERVRSLSPVWTSAGRWRYRTKAGATLTVAVASRQVVFDGRAARLSLLTDLSEVVESEARLEQSQRDFQAIFEHSSLGIYRSSRDGRILLANPALARLLGYGTAGELLHLDLARHVYLDPARREEIIAEHEGLGEYSVEVPWKRRDGRPFWALITTRAVKDGAGQTLYFEGFVQDVTERREAATELETSRRHLRQLTAGLQEIREQERKVMAREIHDELGQALTALRMDLAWLRERLPAPAPGVAKKVREMGALIEQTIGSVRRLATELRPPVLDDLGLVAAIEWQVEEIGSRSGLTWTLDLPADIAIDDARATAVFRIFQEALTNIARHAGARAVAVALRVEPGDIVLEVADDGRGITAAELANRHALGILGMRERALAWNGAIEVSTRPEGGTVVRLRLPLDDRA